LIDPATGRSAVLRSPKDGETIEEARSFVLAAHGYDSEGDASVDAQRWRIALELAFARLLVGVDFGDRAAKGAFTEAGLRWLEEQHQARILNDEHGTMVYKSEPRPQFVSQAMDFAVGKALEELSEVVAVALERAVAPTEQQRTAYELFSSSFFQTSADARCQRRSNIDPLSPVEN
jgi:hypothetical protein